MDIPRHGNCYSYKTNIEGEYSQSGKINNHTQTWKTLFKQAKQTVNIPGRGKIIKQNSESNTLVSLIPDKHNG